MIAGLIVRCAWVIIRHSADVLLDAAILEPAEIEAIARAIPGVHHVHQTRSRGHRDAAYVDLHVLVDPQMSVTSAHDLAHRIEQAIKERVPGVVDVLVHVEPNLPGMEQPEDPRIEPQAGPPPGSGER